MGKKYSLYEAKAKLSQLVRQVREGGQPVTITVHGKAAVEIRQIVEETRLKSAEERHAELEAAGLIHKVPSEPGVERLAPQARRPGALKRFVESRD